MEPIQNIHILMIDQAGQLDRRITIQTFTTSTDAFGQKVKSFSTLANVWAKVEVKVGKEDEEADAIAATAMVDFFIRYRDDINEQMRIIYNNETYKIKAIKPADSRKSFQMVRCLYTDAQ